MHFSRILSCLIILLSIHVIASQAQSIQPYNKQRDHAFITKLTEQFVHDCPESYLFADLDSEIIHVDWPDKNGGPAFPASYKQKIFVYCINNAPVAFVRICTDHNPPEQWLAYQTWVASPVVETDNVGGIQQLMVAAEYQHQGIGEKLLYHALDYLKQQKLRAASLTVMTDNSASQKLFEKVGFTMTRDVKAEESYWGAYRWYVIDLNHYS